MFCQTDHLGEHKLNIMTTMEESGAVIAGCNHPDAVRTSYGLEHHPKGCRPLISSAVTGMQLESHLDLTRLGLSNDQIAALGVPTI